MLVLGSSCKYRLSLAGRFDCRQTIINELLAGSYQNPICEWQVTIKLYLVSDYNTNFPTPNLWKIAFYKTGPWCQKKLGPLL